MALVLGPPTPPVILEWRIVLGLSSQSHSDSGLADGVCGMNLEQHGGATATNSPLSPSPYCGVGITQSEVTQQTTNLRVCGIRRRIILCRVQCWRNKYSGSEAGQLMLQWQVVLEIYVSTTLGEEWAEQQPARAEYISVPYKQGRFILCIDI